MERFDNDTVMTLSTQDLNYLRHCDQKIGAAQLRVTTPEMVVANTSIAGFRGVEYTQEQADSEITRLSAARKEIMKRLSKDDKAEYRAFTKATGPKEMTEDVVAKFCHFVFFFPSREIGEKWVAKNPGTVLLSLDDAFELAKRRNRGQFQEALDIPFE